MNGKIFLILTAVVLLTAGLAVSQPVYFADGQHGGVYGHYPPYVTQFLVDQLREHPDWRINLELEPSTWDVVQTNTPSAYAAFKELAADQSADGRIEFVNPQYGQSYLWNITGESIIRQFDYGSAKLREHFPNAVFSTYASEEPMFTSALPEILRSFGFKNAVLKNPDTCWGGYTRAFGGELVNWIGPDGTGISTVPRYAIEALKPGSTWQTIAWNDSTDYINAAFSAGIQHPIGMCFQDAGWRNGPWLGDGKTSPHPVEYETWRHYFEKIAVKKPSQDWHFSQEDVLVSLMWGTQVLQQIAQEARGAENKVLVAEKLAALARVYAAAPWPKTSLDEAWRTLLLSEHHDCWIVPYNMKNGSTWAQHVAEWADASIQTSEALIQRSMKNLSPSTPATNQTYVRVFNTLGVERTALVSATLPGNWDVTAARILNSQNDEIPSQLISGTDSHTPEILFRADVPALGYNTYRLEQGRSRSTAGAGVFLIRGDGTYKIETDLYQIVLDPSRGGVISSLIAKKLGGKEFVDGANARNFGEIRGYFYHDDGFHSSADHPATISILENGPLRVRAEIRGSVDSQPFRQVITVTEGQPAIDFDLKLDWNGNPGIGSDYGQDKPWKSEDDRKAFYDDSYKLLALFPLNLQGQKVFKNAPFDVTESRLTNTFFTTWSGIKNNIILNWVDVADDLNNYGLALLTDHTTSYTHGENFPLGLTLQYAGNGLWGKNYRITGPSEIHYALIPHSGRWDQAGIWKESDAWNQPLIAVTMNAADQPGNFRKSLVDVTGTGLEVSAVMFQGNDLVVRAFNADGDSGPKKITCNVRADQIQIVELNGSVLQNLHPQINNEGANVVIVNLPKFGIRTIKYCNARE